VKTQTISRRLLFFLNSFQHQLPFDVLAMHECDNEHEKFLIISKEQIQTSFLLIFRPIFDDFGEFLNFGWNQLIVYVVVAWVLSGVESSTVFPRVVLKLMWCSSRGYLVLIISFLAPFLIFSLLFSCLFGSHSRMLMV
jgi:hypothetical protein